MMRLCLVSLMWFTACAPLVPVVEAGVVARTERQARGVELCVLVQEQATRPRMQGVAELSFEPWNYTIASVALRHPTAGLIILDPSFGESIGDDLRRAGPLVMAAMGTERTKTPLTTVLRDAGLAAEDVQFAFITHAHWDHTGALGDLPNATVFVSRTELTWLSPFTRFMDHGVMPHHFKRAKDRLRAFDFTGPAIDGFAHTFDPFGDGSVIAVPLPGHTPGSTAFLVRDEANRTWLFSGDTTWTSRGVELPAHKALRLFDENLNDLSASVGQLHAFFRHRPDVRVVPAHDGDALAQLPRCGHP